MRKNIVLALLGVVCCLMVSAQQKVSILGDSYSTFKGYLQPDTNAVWYPSPDNRNDVVKVEQTWWYQFINNYGYQLEVNNSFSGSTICNTGYRKEDYSDRSFITRMDKLGNPDIVLIFGATNDSWAKVPLGKFKYAGWTKEELYSFRPALAYLFDGCKKLYPKAQLYFVLNSELRDSINHAVHSLCDFYGVECIKLHDIDKQRNHPSQAGMKAISEQIKAFMDEREEDLKDGVRRRPRGQFHHHGFGQEHHHHHHHHEHDSIE